MSIKKKLVTAIIIVVVFLIVAFSLILLYLGLSNHDFWEGKRPSDRVETTWVSSDPDITFTVDKNAHCVGVVKTEDTTKQVVVSFRAPHSGIDISELVNEKNEESYYSLLDGNIKSIKDDKITIKVNTEYDELFEGKYKEITFYLKDGSNNSEIENSITKEDQEQTTCWMCDRR